MVNRVCVVCGCDFQSKTARAKYCSEYCKNRSRYDRSKEECRDESNAVKRSIVDLYYTDLSCHEIADIVGKSKTFVYSVWRDAGLPKRLTQHQKKVMELRKRGKCSVEIADALGISCKTVITTATIIGMPFTEQERQKSIDIAHKKAIMSRFGDRKQRQIDFVAKYYPEWRFLDGILSGDGYVRLQCGECGLVVKKSATTVRRRRAVLICPLCEERHKQERTRKREIARKELEQKKAKNYWSRDFQQITLNFSECKECGTYYIAKRSGFCSDECRRKHINRAHDKRIDRASIVDRSITLEKLYSRDNGVCWLCGGKCDYGDYTKDVNGNFVVGANYPSIDHVYPLSRGGNHEWDNVRLAHHYCNTLKNDKVV